MTYLTITHKRRTIIRSVAPCTWTIWSLNYSLTRSGALICRDVSAEKDLPMRRRHEKEIRTCTTYWRLVYSGIHWDEINIISVSDLLKHMIGSWPVMTRLQQLVSLLKLLTISQVFYVLHFAVERSGWRTVHSRVLLGCSAVLSTNSGRDVQVMFTTKVDNLARVRTKITVSSVLWHFDKNDAVTVFSFLFSCVFFFRL